MHKNIVQTLIISVILIRKNLCRFVPGTPPNYDRIFQTCGNTTNCFSSRGCSHENFSTTHGCSNVIWQKNQDNKTLLDFQISKNLGSDFKHPDVWTGMAIANKNTMSDGDAYICQITSEHDKGPNGVSKIGFTTNVISGRGAPRETNNSNIKNIYFATKKVVNKITNLTDIILFCQFSRPITPVDVDGIAYSNYKLESNIFYLLLASGPWNPKVQPNGRPDYHKTDRVSSSEKLDFLFFNRSNLDISTSKPYKMPLIRAHGCLQMITWGCLVKISIFTSAFSKFTFSDGRTWFLIHKSLSIGIGILCFVGIITAFACSAWQFYGQGKTVGSDPKMIPLEIHSIIGVIVTILMLINILLGFFRPRSYKFKNLRRSMTLAHKIIGYSTSILANVNIFLGLYVYEKNTWSWMATVFLVMEVFNFLVTIVTKWGESKDGFDVGLVQSKTFYVLYLVGLGLCVTAMMIGFIFY